MINKKRLLKLTQDLIHIDSQNPPGDESRIAGFVKAYLGKIGIRTKIYAFKKNRLNIVAIMPGKDSRHSLLITPHLDTVPAGNSWSKQPLLSRIIKNKIYGLGATDCKGNLASALEAMNSLVEDRIVLPYGLIFAATADEESGSELGLAPLLNKGILKPDAALVLDSDDFSIIVAQKGLMHIKIRITGKKAHGAYPWLGSNAIDKSLDILDAIRRLRFSYKKNRYLRPPTINIGTIKGGDKVNVVADWCEFELDLRFLPGSSAKALLGRIRKIISGHTKKFTLQIEGIQNPYIIEKTHPLIKYLKKAMEKSGINPRLQGSEGATVISFFQKKKIPAIATGFGCEGQAHVADEYVTVDNLYKGSCVLAEFLKGYKFD